MQSDGCPYKTLGYLVAGVHRSDKKMSVRKSVSVVEALQFLVFRQSKLIHGCVCVCVCAEWALFSHLIFFKSERKAEESVGEMQQREKDVVHPWWS